MSCAEAVFLSSSRWTSSSVRICLSRECAQDGKTPVDYFSCLLDFVYYLGRLVRLLKPMELVRTG